MLIRESKIRPKGVVNVMNDTAVIAASVKTALLDIAKQAGALGSGLQNAAPGDKVNTPNNSVQYLIGSAEILAKLSEECDDILSAAINAN